MERFDWRDVRLIGPAVVPMNDEIELKLESEPGAARELLADPPWLKALDHRSERQLSVYFDTPDLRLRNNGYVLRVRAIGERFVQTLKSLDSGAGLFDRGEWEWEVDAPEPDLRCLADTPMGMLRIDRLDPVMRSDIDRTIYRVDQAGSEVELDIDQGLICAGQREIPVSELEVELISGKANAAVELARRVSAQIPVKLSVMSKAERGFALAEGKLSQPMKAEPIALRLGMKVAEAFEIIASACLRHFRLNEPLVIESRNAEALHQARVAMRRLRSALSLFRPVVADREFQRIHEELRWFTAELGDARNFDVYLDRDLSIDQRRFVQARREQAYDLAIAAMNSRRFRQLMLDLVGWASVGKWRRKRKASKGLASFMNRRISQLWSKVIASKKLSMLDDQARHRLRIRIKKLRYALEFGNALYRRKGRRKKKFMKTLKLLQRALGDLHDGVVCRSLVTLNSWMAAPNPSADGEGRLVQDADRALHRLRKTGAYWA
jgi:inorganic triphosphatase YgiF